MQEVVDVDGLRKAPKAEIPSGDTAPLPRRYNDRGFDKFRLTIGTFTLRAVPAVDPAHTPIAQVDRKRQVAE